MADRRTAEDVVGLLPGKRSGRPTRVQGDLRFQLRPGSRCSESSLCVAVNDRQGKAALQGGFVARNSLVTAEKLSLAKAHCVSGAAAMASASARVFCIA